MSLSGAIWGVVTAAAGGSVTLPLERRPYTGRSSQTREQQMEILGPLLVLIIGMFALYIVVWFYIILPMEMADERGRSKAIWVLISILMSPFLAIFLLWLLGNAPWKNERGA
jgi:hypothetical protein